MLYNDSLLQAHLLEPSKVGLANVAYFNSIVMFGGKEGLVQEAVIGNSGEVSALTAVRWLSFNRASRLYTLDIPNGEIRVGLMDSLR